MRGGGRRGGKEEAGESEGGGGQTNVLVIISPYFGNLSTKHGYRSVLMVASALIAVGALAYTLAWNKEALIAAQIVMGVGSGTLGVTRAYVADKSTPEQRTYLLAYTT
eukprot:jgi/Undpi1/9778/HiC_scaffold_27.g12234.m1